ncbi:biotin carboxyl carrier protein of acetyl-CoA carboxylase, chloroplastic-like [Silene latifolia]|uniref:biotin carboxyl carrier protein of acetyl-CoA carboxylase, chloroplastic-like n=1 Tax=Silene latifolia TaxID=37657 RepID=UPI003D781235
MSSCIPTAVAAATAVETTVATTSSLSPTLSLRRRRHVFSSHSLSSLAFSLSSSFPNLRLFSQNTQQGLRTGSVAATAQLNNASLGGSSSETASTPEASAQEIKNGKPSSESVTTQASEESISEFIAQVARLVKLVDSRDIVELQMKQSDCEILIRKKEAIIQSPPAPVFMMQSTSQQAAPSYASAPVAAPSASPASAPPVPKPATSTVPPLKSPMAGTFYRSPSPGSPAFVKVGDKVQKGQVLCIIEAMKLMNEIEADQSGTVVQVLAEDGKPVSLDTPLFAIQP